MKALALLASPTLSSLLREPRSWGSGLCCPLSWPCFTPPTVSRVSPCLEGPLFSQLSLPLPPRESRGWSPHLRASMQPAGGGSRQARSSQPAAGRRQEIGPQCGRQAVSTERGRKPDRSAPPLPLAPQNPPQVYHVLCYSSTHKVPLFPIQSPAFNSTCDHSSSSCLILPFPTFLFSFLFSLYIYLLSLQSSFSYSSLPPS